MNRKQFLKSSILAPLATLLPVSAKAEEITHEIFFPDDKLYLSLPKTLFNCHGVHLKNFILQYEQRFSELFKLLSRYHGTSIRITNLTEKQIEELRAHGLELKKTPTKDSYWVYGGKWKYFVFKGKNK